jgi:WD40 repeat protein
VTQLSFLVDDLVRLEGASADTQLSRILSVAAHPHLPIAISAHEDETIRLYDLNAVRKCFFSPTIARCLFVFNYDDGMIDRLLGLCSQGACIHTMRAHADSVTSVCVDSSSASGGAGRHLLSAGHDSTLRTWDLATMRCLHDMAEHQTHRKKYDEACDASGILRRQSLFFLLLTLRTHCCIGCCFSQGIHSIAIHKSTGLMASGGADSIARLYYSI